MKRISLVLGTLVVLSIMASFAQSFAQTASQADFNALVAKRITLSAEFDKKYAETPHLADQFRDVTALQKSYDAAYAKHNEWAKNPPSRSERDAHDAAIAKLIPLIAAHTVPSPTRALALKISRNVKLRTTPIVATTRPTIRAPAITTSATAKLFKLRRQSYSSRLPMQIRQPLRIMGRRLSWTHRRLVLRMRTLASTLTQKRWTRKEQYLMLLSPTTERRLPRSNSRGETMRRLSPR